MNQGDLLTMTQACREAGVSRSTAKRRLSELEDHGAFRLSSGQWRIPRSALAVFETGSSGSCNEPDEPGQDEPREPVFDPPHDPGEPVGDDLAAARVEAAAWKARAEERAMRIEELVKRAESAEARLDQMLTNQTAMALALKDAHAQIESAPPPEPPAPDESSEKPNPFLTGITPSPAPHSEPESIPPAPVMEREGMGTRMRKWWRG